MRTPARERRDGASLVNGVENPSRIEGRRWRNQIVASATYGDENSEGGPRTRASDSPRSQLRDIAREPFCVHGACVATSAVGLEGSAARP